MVAEVKVYKIGRSLRMSQSGSDERHPYRIGFVTAPAGTVGFYTQAGLTIMSFAADGREVRARFDRGFTERGLITACRRFAAEATDRLAAPALTDPETKEGGER